MNKNIEREYRSAELEVALARRLSTYVYGESNMRITIAAHATSNRVKNNGYIKLKVTVANRLVSEGTLKAITKQFRLMIKDFRAEINQTL